MNFILTKKSLSILLGCSLFIACNFYQKAGTTRSMEFDTVKYALAKESQSDSAILKLMLEHKLHPVGYFSGPNGVLPSGDINWDTLRKERLTRTPDGGIDIYYTFLEGKEVKIDTFTVSLGMLQ